MTTGALVNLPVIPTSDSEYTSAASPGERRAKPQPSKLLRILLLAADEELAARG